MSRLTINPKRVFALLGVLLAVLFVSTACTSGGKQGSGQKKESATQQSNYDRLQSEEPALTMAVSQTRLNINRWISTWGKDPNKLAYVYLQNDSGKMTGYYVLKGLPVSYCTSLTPNYKIIWDGGSDGGGNFTVPAPSIDGVYYSGGECNTYYGFTADTGAYIEYTAGLGINVLIYDQPLSNHPNVPNLAPTK